MGKSYYLSFFLLLGAIVFLFCPQKAKAAETAIVISEVMVDPGSHNDVCASDKCEWIELFNTSENPVDLNGWTIDEKVVTASTIIQPNDYLIITKDKASFLSIWPLDSNKVIQLAISLVNSRTDSLTIANGDVSYSETFTWDAPAGEDKTWEKIDLTENSSDNWRPSIIGGTPGQAPEVEDSLNYPDEITDLVNINAAVAQTVTVSRVIDGDTIEVTGLKGLPQTVRLLGIDCAESGQALFDPGKNFTNQLLNQTVDLLISADVTEQLDIYNRTLAVVIFGDEVFNTKLLRKGLATFYESSNSLIKNSTWEIFADEARDEKLGLWASSGGRFIYFTEILPDPTGDDASGEWIELFNSSDGPVDLSYYKLDSYFFLEGTILPAHSYLVLNRSKSDITLNNSGDNLKLYFPDGILADEVSYGKAEPGMSWALINDSWLWTVELTPGSSNIYTSKENVGGDDEVELPREDIPKNTVPVKIATGEFQNYENFLVTVTGTVVETSGNTFYLDDGSGKAKVYIQAATEIDKPSMHKGDIFEITGIVNLYRNTWRILPQKQDDIKLIQAMSIVKIASTATVKKAKASTSSTKKTTSSNAQARAPTDSNKEVAAAINTKIKVDAIKSPWWIEVIKVLVGLSFILLVGLIIKLVRTKKIKPIGGDFGDET